MFASVASTFCEIAGKKHGLVPPMATISGFPRYLVLRRILALFPAFSGLIALLASIKKCQRG